MSALIELSLFTAKSAIILLFILIVFVAFFALLAKGKQKVKGRLVIKNLNDNYAETKETLLQTTLSKKQFKQFLKEKKRAAKKDAAITTTQKNIYVLTFQGDIKASAVSSLAEEVTAILPIATPQDEVILRLESPGGAVHAYGLAAAQLMRLRDQHIPLTVTVDKVAASGGYLMACIANKILAAPFAIIGSIGVIVQLPNFHRFLKDKDIDMEMHTAGEYKRTITLFGENTEAGREKLQQELEDIHQQFKNVIQQNRQHIDIEKVATGEYWLGQEALTLNLVDEIKTSDAYLLECSKTAKLYEITYQVKKPFLTRLSSAMNLLQEKLFSRW